MPTSKPRFIVPRIYQDEGDGNEFKNPYNDRICDLLEEVTPLLCAKWSKQQRARSEIMYHSEGCTKFQSAVRQEQRRPYVSKTDWECECSTPGSESHRVKILGEKRTAVFQDSESHDSHHLLNCDRIVRGKRRLWCDDDNSVEVVNPSRVYESKTIAMDVLRAAQFDPTLPPLDPRLHQWVQEAMAEQERRSRTTGKGGRPKKSSSKRQKLNL